MGINDWRPGIVRALEPPISRFGHHYTIDLDDGNIDLVSECAMERVRVLRASREREEDGLLVVSTECLKDAEVAPRRKGDTTKRRGGGACYEQVALQP